MRARPDRAKYDGARRQRDDERIELQVAAGKAVGEADQSRGHDHQIDEIWNALSVDGPRFHQRRRVGWGSPGHDFVSSPANRGVEF